MLAVFSNKPRFYSKCEQKALEWLKYIDMWLSYSPNALFWETQLLEDTPFPVASLPELENLRLINVLQDIYAVADYNAFNRVRGGDPLQDGLQRPRNSVLWGWRKRKWWTRRHLHRNIVNLLRHLKTGLEDKVAKMFSFTLSDLHNDQVQWLKLKLSLLTTLQQEVSDSSKKITFVFYRATGKDYFTYFAHWESN